MTLPSSELTPDNCVFLMIDHQVGLMQFLSSVDPMLMKNNILGHAKTAKAFDIPVIMGTSWPNGPNGPTMPELKAIFPEVEVIDRPFVNFWNDEASRKAVEATGRKKLVISGLATEVCAAFPAISALRDGYEVYVVIDASADFNPMITQVTATRLAAAGAIVTTWVAVLAELAGNTQINGQHIGKLLSEHMGQYQAAMNNFLATAENAEEVRHAVGLNGQPPIPMAAE
ncbi:isochorismatase family protein [Cognatiyoonia sp. IB215182]|uniref:isochorismatase family protein n=1 Tax=Cognatiyoonia sp. IB215182 TaxID=3097353 RepID=UPI002A12FA15|nr:isochorismatase family protein [Cognatiyoonia sp. IB215182]MDX8355202.1 isochorismatase family protein [Cognatiyoonia sp. IB215182]